MKRILPISLTLCLILGWQTAAYSQEGISLDPSSETNAAPYAVQRGEGQGRGRVYRDRVDPQWIEGTSRFWYRVALPEGRQELVVVDAEKGTRQPAFDHAAVAKALGQGTAERLPIDALQWDAASQRWILIGKSGQWFWNETAKTVEATDRGKAASTSNKLTSNVSDDAPRTGMETEVVFENQLENEVEIFWLSTEGRRQSYGKIAPKGSRSQHTFGGHRWAIVDHRGETLGTYAASDTPSTLVIDGKQSSVPRGSGGPRRPNRPRGPVAREVSPDGKWRVFVRDSNLFLQSTEPNAPEAKALTQDGKEGNAYSQFSWSPDSRFVAAFRTETAEKKEVHLVQSSPPEGGRAVLHSRSYALPGDTFTRHQVQLIAVENGNVWTPQVEPFESEWARPIIRWSPQGNKLRYEQIDRGHQRFRVFEFDPADRTHRTLVDEQSKTFIWTMHIENHNLPPVMWLSETDEFIHVSEQEGWRHLYLIDAKDGTLKNRITQGSWVVRGIDSIDEEKRQIWFRASGIYPDQDPYLIHYGRVNFDGTGLVWLTAGHGHHTVQYSPDKRFLIDSYSRVDLAPVSELRRVSDGSLVCQLEEADVSSLKQSGWKAPEVFVAKGRDGKTDIWGIICRPKDYDPTKKYPVIEDIYAGPQSSYVPKTFSASQRYESLNRLGFVVVKIDGMGTANRSKAFHDVCFQNLKDAGFEDRILWMKAAGKKYPELDLDRVGIYGTSAGGQNAGAAVLFHPEFYKVAVAACGCHDNRMDKASWNEQWMGYPVGPHYAASSNIDNAHRLGGKLLLIVGEMDTNVPPESTLRYADALIRANKDFDLLVVPNAGHGMGGAYGQRRMHDYFVQHLKPNAG
ncbi:MAG: prolyl oligopeptidase family serine peptidase [Pirellulales bacterium]